MLKSRAKEIYNSLGVYDVEYKGKCVWINEIIYDEDKAIVKDMKTSDLYEADITDLYER